MTIVNFSGPNFPEIFLQKIIFKKWFKKTGDAVTSGEILCEIANGQKIASLKASTGGVLIELLANDGSILMPKQLLARINTAPLAESQQPAPEIKTEPEHPPVAAEAETVAPVTNVLTEKDDLKDQASDAAEAADTITAQSIEQISLLSNKIEVLANSINTFHQSRAAERLEILKILENSAVIKIDEINSSVKQICDRLDFLDDQFKTIASQFSTAIEAVRTAQVKTLEEVAKVSSANSAEEKQLSSELAELQQMLAALQKPHTANPAPQVTDMRSFLSWLGLQNRLPFSSLRNRLLPLGLLPNAVIDDINELALSLTGEPALEQDGDNIIVQSQVLMQVIGAWQHNE